MSTIAELEDKVKELMNEIETLKQKEKAEEFEYPFEYDKKYLVIYHNGDIGVYNWTNHKMDKEAYSQGNAFKTKEEATRERDKRALLTRFRQFRDKCNGDWEPDRNSGKHYLVVNPVTNVIEVKFIYTIDMFALFGYFKSESDANSAIELFGDEIKRLWVEE